MCAVPPLLPNLHRHQPPHVTSRWRSLQCVLFKKNLPDNKVKYLLYANGSRLTWINCKTKVVEVFINDGRDDGAEGRPGRRDGTEREV